MSVGLSFSTTLCNHHSYTSSNHKDTNREEEPEEPLGIAIKIKPLYTLYSVNVCKLAQTKTIQKIVYNKKSR